MNGQLQMPSRINVVGHPCITIGMGSHVRGVFRSLRAANLQPTLTNIYGIIEEEHADDMNDIMSALGGSPFCDINIFCINADEVEPVTRHLGASSIKDFGSYNIIYPMWELPSFPESLIGQLEKFDEVWAPSKFIMNSLNGKISNPLLYMPIACEVPTVRQRTRRFFDIPEDSFNIMFSFDFLSYVERKNPLAVVEMFRRTRDLLPSENLSLLIKTNNGNKKQREFERFTRALKGLDGIRLIDKTLSASDVRALIYLSDAYVSLHRAEGFGLGMAEAMCLGTPVLCTGWSGNMDFCDTGTAQLVEFDLTPVRRGQYVHWENQHWAEPNTESAASKMASLISEPSKADELILNAKSHMAIYHSYSTVGLNYKQRLNRLHQREA